MRKIVPWILVALSVLLDTSVIPILSSGWCYPLMALCTVITLALLLGRTHGALYGMLAGILLDSTTSMPFGLMLVLYSLAGTAAGYAGRKWRKNVFMTLFVPAILFFFFEMCMLGYTTLAGSEFTASALPQAGIRILLNTALVQLDYLLFGALCRPESARYEMR